MDDRKWAKVPSIPADAFILDLEDAVPPDLKVPARQRVVEYLAKPAYFNDAIIVPRANGLDTPWGHDDLVALAEAGASTIMYPKVDNVEELHTVLALCAAHGATPDIVASIESASGVLEAKTIFSHERVVAATFGPGDLHVDAGMALYEPDGSMNPGLLFPKVQTILAGVVHGVVVLGIAFSRDLKDLDDMRARLEAERRLGFSGLCAFYPPHVPLINEAFSPSDVEVARAREIITSYEAALADGKPAVQLSSGEALLAHQYKEAQDLLARAGA
jgi:citrate lyase beta subunit